MSNFYVTTPIYYVNDLPHIGHIYTTVVADTVARYRRMAGDDVYFLTGTDEHGQNIERAAHRQGLEPLELADRVVARYHQLWQELGFSHDDFIRTTEPRHRRGVNLLIELIRKAGDLYVDRHEGWYCSSCEAFYTEKELFAGDSCPVHESPVEWRSEENVFFRLSRYQRPLLEWYEQHPESVRPESRANEVRSFVESGLRDLSVSRAGLSWGIPFPGSAKQTVYVWLDALTNYISALGFGGDSADDQNLYQKYWGGEDGTRLHLVGKDILRFHAVYWPAFLLSAGLPLPTTVWAHGWWLRDQRKISKSVGNIVRPDHLLTDFGADPLRFYLLRDMVFGQDAGFSDEGFVDRFNGDLANDLGNTVSRLVTLSRRAFSGGTPAERCEDNRLIAAAAEATGAYRRAMDELGFHRALEALWRLLAEANQYLVSREPWKLLKSEGASQRVSRVLWNAMEAVRIVAVGLLPVMPRTAPRVLAALGIARPPEDLAAMSWGGLPTGGELPQPEALFPRIDREIYLGAATQNSTGAAVGDIGEKDAEEGQQMITIDQFSQTDLKVGTVLSAEPIPGSDKLLKLTVDLGAESRTLVAGIARQYQPDELTGRQVVIVANLQPARLMGVESQGMVLAADVDGDPVLLVPGRPVPDGTPVR